MIIEIADASHPPGNLRPRTLFAAVAIILQPLEIGACVTIAGIRNLSGLMVTPAAIRSAVSDFPIPDRTYSVRILANKRIQFWRNT